MGKWFSQFISIHEEDKGEEASWNLPLTPLSPLFRPFNNNNPPTHPPPIQFFILATMKFFSSSSKKSKKTINISDRPPSSFSSASSDTSGTPTTPTTVLSAPPVCRRYIGRNASCLDPEYDPPREITATTIAGRCKLSSCNYSSSSLRRDEDGKLTCEELRHVLWRLNGGVVDDVSGILAELDRDGDGRINLEELLKAREEDKAREEEELRVAFGVYDADGDGKISAEELWNVFQILGDETCRIEDCRKMIGSVDSDGDGYVCFKDFAKMMSNSTITS